MSIIFQKSDWAYTREANSKMFDDFAEVSKKSSYPKAIFHRSGDMFDSIGIEYSDGVKIKHGGDGGGRTQRFELGDDEYITKMDIYYGSGFFIYGISFYTNKNRKHDAGYMAGTKKTIDFNGYGLICFYGASASMYGINPSNHCLTGLGAYTKDMGGKTIYSHILLEGISTDSRWDDIIPYYEISKNRVLLPTSIQIWNGQFLDKIQVSYSNLKMEAHGINEPGWERTFNFSAGEYVTKVSGEANPITQGGNLCQIGKLVFKTNLGKSYEFNSWCPYSGQPFSFELPEGAALVALGGRFGGQINIISGLILHYVYIDDKHDKADCQIMRNSLDKESFKGVSYEALSKNSNPDSNVWVNTIEEIVIPEECDLLCASISNEENDVLFPNGVYTEMSGPDGKLSPKEGDLEHVHTVNDSFYQMYTVKPEKGTYKMLVRHRTDAQLFIEYQCIIRNYDNINLAQSMPYDEENKLPFYGRPLQRLLIVNVAGPQIAPETCELLAAPVIYTIMAFAHLHPFFTAAALTVGGISVIYGLYKSFQKDEVESKKEKEMEETACWSVTRKDNRKIYEPLREPSFTQFARFKGETKTKEFEDTLALYNRLLDKNGNDLHASKMKRITREDLQGKKLVVDVGGEGFVRDIGIRVAGVTHALNLNGRVNDGVYRDPIPLLIRITDWDSDNFPFEDGLVDAFIMQATPPPTLKTADEIIRCMNKETGRIDLILNELDNKILMCYQYIRNGLGFGIYQGEEMVRQEYPHLVGAEYLTIYSSKYKPPVHHDW